MSSKSTEQNQQIFDNEIINFSFNNDVEASNSKDTEINVEENNEVPSNDDNAEILEFFNQFSSDLFSKSSENENGFYNSDEQTDSFDPFASLLQLSENFDIDNILNSFGLESDDDNQNNLAKVFAMIAKQFADNNGVSTEEADNSNFSEILNSLPFDINDEIAHLHDTMQTDSLDTSLPTMQSIVNNILESDNTDFANQNDNNIVLESKTTSAVSISDNQSNITENVDEEDIVSC